MVSLELALEKARSQLETSLNEKVSIRGYSVVYATVSYPRDGNDAAKLYRLLVNRLMNSGNRLFNNLGFPSDDDSETA